MTVPEITVCICTYKRPEMLARLLEHLQRQVTKGQFEYSIAVVDNDANRSAEPVVRTAQESSPLKIEYAVEPQANIAVARNRTLELAAGDYAAFIDDDEYPGEHWLAALFTAARRFDADGVIGFVKPDFGREPARWISKGRFFFKPAPPPPPTGTVLSAGITSNALVSMHTVRRTRLAFDPSFGRSGGEDDKFFRDLLACGLSLVFCAEAIVHETIPFERQSAAYLWKRHHLQGRTFVRINRAMRGTSSGLSDLAKSVCAASLYTLALPFLLLAGRHVAVDYSLRLAWHIGYIAAALRLGGSDDREQFESYMQSTD
ncbi:MAG TPA: glycosyltransferase [Gammaproteobacteria bacterium]|nr:glycosyltransferase [Gammaproteobacteria bacterium]